MPRQDKEGFLIYRTGCKDSSQWERFMAFFKYQVRHSLEVDDTLCFYDHIDWKVIVGRALYTCLYKC